MVGSVDGLGVLKYSNQFVKRSLLKSKERTWFHGFKKGEICFSARIVSSAVSFCEPPPLPHTGLTHSR